MTTADDTLPEPAAAPGAAPSTNAQPATSDASQAAPALPSATTTTTAGPLKPAPSTFQQSAAAIQQMVSFNLLNQIRPRHWPASVPAKPRIGENDLLVEGLLKLTSRAGTVVQIPLSTKLTGTLSPAFLPLAELQFATLLDQLLIKPATIAFTAHLESFKAGRAADAGKTKLTRAAEQEKENDAMRDILTHKNPQ